MNHELIEQYAGGAAKLASSIVGLIPEDLAQVPPADADPTVGRWSIQQVVLHLADAEIAFADRARRIIAMDDPSLLAWDENRFAERLLYQEQSAQDAVQMVDLNRRMLARVLRKLPESAFERTGIHSVRGRQSLLDVLNYAVNHLEHHLKFIYAKREQFGKLVW